LNIQIVFHVTLYEVNNMKKIATAMFEDLHKIKRNSVNIRYSKGVNTTDIYNTFLLRIFFYLSSEKI